MCFIFKAVQIKTCRSGILSARSNRGRQGIKNIPRTKGWKKAAVAGLPTHGTVSHGYNSTLLTHPWRVLYKGVRDYLRGNSSNFPQQRF